RRAGGGMDLLYSRLPAQESTARHLAHALHAARPGWSFTPAPMEASFGGGSYPDEALAGWAVEVDAPSWTAARLDSALRTGRPAVLGLLHRGRYRLHVAALLPDDTEAIAARLRELGNG